MRRLLPLAVSLALAAAAAGATTTGPQDFEPMVVELLLNDQPEAHSLVVLRDTDDVGTCWRVAQQLVSGYGQQVRLWVDDLDTFRRILPDLDPAREVQFHREVEIRRWSQSMPAIEPAEVVVDAFACRLPESFQRAMAARTPRPVWINLEYFSAESWVAGSQGLSSPHPRLPLTQYFFIPGIGPGTGGLPGNPAELTQLAAFQSGAAAQAAFWRELGVAEAGALRISLFANENPAIHGLVEALRQAGRPMQLLAIGGQVTGTACRGPRCRQLEAWQPAWRGRA